MADKNIGALPPSDGLYDDSLFVVEHSGTAKRVSGRQFKDYAKEGVETYVESAQKAAQDAVGAAAKAEAAIQDTQASKEAAQAAQTAAETAEQGAVEAREAIENMLVEAITKATGEPATVTKELVDGVVKLVFGLPAGPKGDTGDPGSSIQSIARTGGTGAPGTMDTYTITLTDGSTTTFTVYNGADGIGAGDFMANGTVPMTGNLQMGGNRITGLAAPVDDGDAVRKADLAGLTVTTDPTPTQGSVNPVQSGGVFEALAEEAAALEAHKADKENPHEVTAEQLGIETLPLKTVSPADVDTYVITDSSDGNKLKRTKWSVIKTALASIFAPKSSPVFSGSISLGRKSGTTIGTYSFAVGSNVEASFDCSHAEGFQTTASEYCSHAEGSRTTASKPYSHAEGESTMASGLASHAEGSRTTASKHYSHAEGSGTTAAGISSHAEGDSTTALGSNSHASGYGTIANSLQFVIGSYNIESGGPSWNPTDMNLFIIGKGSGDATRSNAFRVHSSAVYGGQYNASGADYAELFEWADRNAAGEDRAGLFVTLEGENIRLASPEDGYILGVVSADPSVVGDVYDDQWAGMYLRDVFGRTVMEMQDFPEETGPEGEVIREAHQELAPKLNPDYRPDETYVPRSQRPEWDAVGMMGKLVMVDDGSCKPNGYCKVAEGGIATRSDTPTPYRVLSRLDETHIRVLIR